jgi:hypothetical protein
MGRDVRRGDRPYHNTRGRQRVHAGPALITGTVLLSPSSVSFIAWRSGLRRHPIPFDLFKPAQRTRTASHFVAASSRYISGDHYGEKGRKGQGKNRYSVVRSRYER